MAVNLDSDGSLEMVSNFGKAAAIVLQSNGVDYEGWWPRKA